MNLYTCDMYDILFNTMVLPCEILTPSFFSFFLALMKKCIIGSERSCLDWRYLFECINIYTPLLSLQEATFGSINAEQYSQYFKCDILNNGSEMTTFAVFSKGEFVDGALMPKLSKYLTVHEFISGPI